MEIIMRDYFKKNKFTIIIFILFIIFIILSYTLKIESGVRISKNFKDFFVEMFSFIPLMFILIGLFDVWVPKEKVQKHTGKDSGILGSLWIILLAMLQAGPLYGAFPVAYMLWKKGTSIRNIFIYISAFPTMKIPLLTFEISFLGLKFTLLRTIVSLPIFVLIAIILEFYLKNKNFEVKEPSK
jgi:uncharacterized membrane protein YraQ (UPF0718 family)